MTDRPLARDNRHPSQTTIILSLGGMFSEELESQFYATLAAAASRKEPSLGYFPQSVVAPPSWPSAIAAEPIQQSGAGLPPLPSSASWGSMPLSTKGPKQTNKRERSSERHESSAAAGRFETYTSFRAVGGDDEDVPMHVPSQNIAQ